MLSMRPEVHSKGQKNWRELKKTSSFWPPSVTHTQAKSYPVIHEDLEKPSPDSGADADHDRVALGHTGLIPGV